MNKNSINIPTDLELRKLLDVNGVLDIIKSACTLNFDSVLDVGFGKGGASLFFASQGKSVTSLGYDIDSYEWPRDLFQQLNIEVINSLFDNFDTDRKFDAIFLSHMLEHTRNPGEILDKCLKHLNDNGWLFIIVPPFKENLAGGHITNGWNLGQLMYNLLLADFNIKDGHFIHHGYNVCAFVQKNNLPSKELKLLRYDNGDLETTSHLWPFDVKQGINGVIGKINWPFDHFKQNAPVSFENTLDKKELQNSRLNNQISFYSKQLTDLQSELSQSKNTVKLQQSKLNSKAVKIALRFNKVLKFFIKIFKP